MNLIPKSSEHLERVGKSIDLTNRLLQEIDDKTVSIDDNYMVLIPDSNFRNYLEENHSISFDESFIEYSKIKHITEITCVMRSIQSLDGIQYFTDLIKLDCSDNDLIRIDISKNKKLQEFICVGCQLTSLDVRKNINLTKLDCFFNRLTNLDVTNNINLQQLSCGMNRIVSIDVSKNTYLSVFECGANQLISIDISKNTKLICLECSQNLLVNLDISKNITLARLECCCNELIDLDLSKNVNLVELISRQNKLSQLDLTKNEYLQKVELNGNPGDWWIKLEKNPFDFWNSLSSIWKQFLYYQTNHDRPEYDDYMSFNYSYNDHLYGLSQEKMHDLHLEKYNQAINLWLKGISEKDIIEILNLERLEEQEPNGWHKLDGLYPISSFKNLKVIDITCQINDFTPFTNLTNLTNLTDVSIIFHNENDENDENDCPILNISPLSNHFNIVNLSLSHFRILDISCLSNLKELEYLGLKRNKITDINPLINLILENKNLSHINLVENLISDISPLFNIPQDKEMLIELYGNPIDENQYLGLKKTHKKLDILY